MVIILYCIPLVLVALIVYIFIFFSKNNKKKKIQDPVVRKESNSFSSSEKSILFLDEQLKKIKHISNKNDLPSELPSMVEKFIDLNQLQKIQDNISKALGIACITVDIEGKPLTKESGFTDFCIKHTRGSSKGLSRCYSCDAGGGTLSAKTNKPAVYRCHSGLVDFGVPILIDNVQIGSILGGQVLIDPPDEDYFRKIACEIEVDEELYIQALRKVPIISSEKVQAAANVLYFVANTLSELGHNKWKASELAKRLLLRSESLVDNTIQSSEVIINQVNSLKNEVVNQSNIIVEFSSTIEELISTINSIAKVSRSKNESSKQLLEMANNGGTSIKETKKAIIDIINNTEQIGNFMKVIDDINQRTNLLAINASIEAAHAGEKGAGFSIVASEIRKLAENSTHNFLEVDKFLKENTKQTEGITNIANNTESSYIMIEKEIKEVLNSLEEITQATGEISNGSNEIIDGISNLQRISSSVSNSTDKIETMINNINNTVIEMKDISDDVSNMSAILAK